MNNSQRLKILIDSGKSVYTLKNLRALWKDSQNTAKMNAKRMVGKGILYRYTKGYYGLNEDFDINELANLIIQPSYISLHTALFYHGVSFQASNIVDSVGLINYEKKVSKYIFKYYSMKKDLFLNLEGIDYRSIFAIAKPERALLDSFYLGILPSIDNTEKINITYLKELSVFYPKSVQKKAEELKTISND